MIFSDGGYTIYALNARTAALLWTYAIGGGGGICTSAAVANGVVYVGITFNNNVYAFGLQQGPRVTQAGETGAASEPISERFAFDALIHAPVRQHHKRHPDRHAHELPGCAGQHTVSERCTEGGVQNDVLRPGEIQRGSTPQHRLRRHHRR